MRTLPPRTELVLAAWLLLHVPEGRHTRTRARLAAQGYRPRAGGRPDPFEALVAAVEGFLLGERAIAAVRAALPAAAAALPTRENERAAKAVPAEFQRFAWQERADLA